VDADMINARAQFHAAATGYWRKWFGGLGCYAKAEREQMRELAAEWAARDRIADLLSPLLADGDRGVRCWAAWHLAENGEVVIALPVLRALDEEWSDVPSFMASLQLERHGYPTRTVQHSNGQRHG
jgi:hypothetical protein